MTNNLISVGKNTPYAMAVLIIMIFAFVPLAAISADEDTLERPRIGLVLSGGGARGAAHVGVIKVLEENRIPIDMIAGTSFGAIVGGLYASGYSASELEAILAAIDWQATLSSSAPRNRQSFRRKQDDEGFLIKFRIGLEDGKLILPSGLITPNNLRLSLRDLVNKVGDVNDFDAMAIPFRAVATDLETGLAVVLDKGDLASAMVASMAVPALFPPVEHDGKLLVDGSVANNVPIDIAREMGADIVIVVDISTPMMTQDQITSFASVVDQLMLILTNQAAAAQLATLTERDILILPDLEGIGPADFEATLEAIPKGEVAARRMLPQMMAFALPQQAWEAHLEERNTASEEPPQIDFINIVSDRNVFDKVIRAHLSLEPGERFNALEMSDDLTKIYGLELFDEVDYSIVEENGQTGVEVRTQLNEHDGHIRFGLAIQEDFEGESNYLLAVGITKLGLNERGGEWTALFNIGSETSLFTEFYQPVDYGDRFYVFANATAGQLNRNIIDRTAKVLSQVRISQAQLQTGAGTNFGQWGNLRVGLQRSFAKVAGRIGTPDDLAIHLDDTTLVAAFEVDTLDNNRFPHSGNIFGVEYENNLPWMNGDTRVDSLLIGGFHPYTWGQNTIGLNYRFATTFNGRPDETDLFPLGGFLSLTAYAPGQLTGNHGGNLAGLYYRRISGGSRLLAQTPIYVGSIFEAGNVWNQRSEMSLGDLHWSTGLFMGADTLIGPVYLGAAVGDDNQVATFLFVGQLF